MTPNRLKAAAIGGGDAAGAVSAFAFVGFLMSLAVDVAFSAIGGVIGAAVFHKKPSA